jgi:large subunit ribosomal protein L25
MPEIVVAAEPRTETGKNVNRRLRAADRIPGVIYGGKAKADAQPVSVSPKEVLQILRSASGENTLFDIELKGTRRKVILKEFQVQPVSGELLHADFFEVALDKLIEVKVHVELVGTPVGVKNQGGLLDFVTRELEIECLPTDIPDRFTVDVSGLELNKHLRVSDLEMPEKVRCLTDDDVVIAHVVVPRAAVAEAEEGEAAEGEAAAAAEPETDEKGDEKADKKADRKADKKADRKEE